MKLSELKPPKGAIKNRKRLGRGRASGHGKTACRGTKGQKARSGGGVPPDFEGGQTKLIRRLPKRGFSNFARKRFAILKVGDLNRFDSQEEISEEVLKRKGLLKKIYDGVKILGDGEIEKPLILKGIKVTKKAKEKIENKGGKISA